jgi:radical SAM protein with 4Fe4S-binding SPASM domain
MNKKDFFYKQNFCTAPWTNLYIDPVGNIQTCSVGKDCLGNINEQSVDEILYSSPKLLEIRRKMLGNEKPSNCSLCYNIESSNKDAYSSRLYYKKISKDTDIKTYDSIENFYLNTLDLRWKNTCQNACIYCDPILSSRWENELNLNSLKGDFTKVKEFIYPKLSQIKEVYLAGGEPLIVKENVEFLTKLYEVNPHAKVRVNSNIKNINTPVYKLTKKFKNLQYTISIDSIEKNYEYLRWPQKWSEFVKNLKIIMQEIEVFNFNITLTAFNHQNLFKTIDYLLDCGFHQNSFIIKHCVDPAWGNMNHLPNEKLDWVAETCKKYIEKLDKQFFLAKALRGVLNFIDKDFEKDLMLAINELQQLDKIRGLDSRSVFPELYECLN